MYAGRLANRAGTALLARAGGTGHRTQRIPRHLSLVRRLDIHAISMLANKQITVAVGTRYRPPSWREEATSSCTFIAIMAAQHYQLEMAL